MGVDPESENQEKGEKKSHCHREDKPRREVAHQPGQPPSQKDRGGECAKKLKVGNEGGASSCIGDDQGIAHAAQDTKIDVDQADDEEHESKDQPFFALNWKDQFLKHSLSWSVRMLDCLMHFRDRLPFPQSKPAMR